MPLMRFLNYIFGYYIFECAASDTEKLLNIFMLHGIPYRDLAVQDDICSFSVISYDVRAFCAICANENIAILKREAGGLFHTLSRYRLRVGLMVGALIFVSTVYASGLFIWEVNVEGNTTVSDRDVKMLLEEHGVRVGAYIPSLDLGNICNTVLSDTEDLSWLAINMNGTSANAVVRETESVKKSENSLGAANLVAVSDGQIELVEAYFGVPMVEIGDAVRAGELLISGVSEIPNSPNKYLRAKGRVFARTTKRIRVEIPLEYQEKVYTGKQKSEKTINFFGKNINLFVNSGNLEGNYDKIEREDPLTFLGSFTVPVSVKTTDYCEYTYMTANRTETEAVRLAHHELSLALEKALEGAELLKKSVTASFSEDAYVIDCELYVIENIAVEAEFETE